MLISHRKQFIFIHIYKTAGTSVMDVFSPYCRLIDRMAYDYKFTRELFRAINRLMRWGNDGMKQYTGFHKHAKAHEIREKLERKQFDSYYKFSFVRNPYDFLVSLYFYAKQFERDPSRRALKDMEYKDFLKRVISNNTACQLDFITDPKDSKLLVDFIGRFETLEKDIAIIQEKLGIKIDGSIKHMNSSFKRKSRDYRVYYDEESRNLVENHFQRDLDLLGYNFNGFNKDMRIMPNF